MEGGRVVQFGTPHEIVLEPANEYVADFVAHMNPLSVLRAGELMTAVGSGGNGDAARILDTSAGLAINGEGAISLRGATAETVRLGEAEPRRGAVALCARDTPVREVMQARLASGLPVLVVEDDRVVGRVGDAEIYGGLLGR